MQKKFYDLQLGELDQLDNNTQILRVPGGWIIKFLKDNSNQMNSIFVPYHTEFKPAESEGSDSPGGIV